MTQLTLDFSDRKTRRRAGPRLAARMMAILAARGDWTTRAQLRAIDAALTDRACRLGRECAHGRILQGQRGYKLLRHATPAEIRAAYGAFISQIEAEQNQAAQLMRRAHAALNDRRAA